MKSSSVSNSRLGFARETDDERRAQGHSRNSGTQLRDQCLRYARATGFAPHPPEASIRRCAATGCRCNARPCRHSRNRLDQFIAPMRRMGVKQSDPEIRPRFFQSRARARPSVGPASGIDRLTRSGFFRPQIHSVIGRVLADQIDFAHSFGHKRANFGKHRFGRAAAMRPRICGITQKLQG